MTAAIAQTAKLCPVHGPVTPRRSRNGRHADGSPRYALRCPRCSVDAARRYWDRLAGKIPECRQASRVNRGAVSSSAVLELLEQAMGHELSGPAREPRQAAPDADLFEILMGRA